jgi:hypothetical protein
MVVRNVGMHSSLTRHGDSAHFLQVWMKFCQKFYIKIDYANFIVL